MHYLCLYGADCNAIKTVHQAFIHSCFPVDWSLFSNLVAFNRSCITGEVQLKLVSSLDGAIRKDLHEVCKAESTTEVSHLCQPSQSFSRSVGQAGVQSGKVRLLCHAGNSKPESPLLSFIYSL